jgi:O-antigen/teichoic acid export membrane protein
VPDVHTVRAILLQTSIYGVGQALRGLNSLILLPIYTHYLTPADYGLVELLMVIVDLTALVLGLRIGAGIFKYYTDADNRIEKNTVISSALGLLTFAGVLGIGCLFVLSDTLADYLQAPTGFEIALRVLSMTLLFSAINETFFAFLRVEDKAGTYVILNFLKFFLQLILSLLFIVYLDYGYWGIIWASLLSGVLLTIFFCIRLWPSIGITISRRYAIKLIHFSIPIVLSSFGMFYITFGNRFLLKAYSGLAAVGIFALAYKLGLTFFGLIWGPFATFWNAKQFEYARKPEAGKLFGQVFFYTNLILIPAAVGVTVLAPHFLRLVTTQEYWGAIEVVPWVVGASVLLSWTDFFRIGSLLSAKTNHIAYGTFAAAAIVTLLYLLWIPTGGPVGAAKAIFVAFVFRFGYLFFVGQQYFAIEVPWHRLGLMLGYFTTLGVLLQSWRLEDGLALIVKGCVLFIGGLLLLMTPVIRREHKMFVLSGIARHFDARHDQGPGSR